MNKITFVGTGGAGKSTFVNRHLTGTFDTRYRATIGVEVNQITHNGVELDIWNTAGQDNLIGLRDGYLLHSNVAVIFIDASRLEMGIRDTKQSIANIRRVCGSIPIIIALNKAEIFEKSSSPEKKSRFFEYLERFGLPVVPCSCRTGKGMDELLDTIISNLSL